MITRHHRYNVSIAYIFEDGRFGKLEPKLMNYNDIDYMLKILEPMKSEEWLNYIHNLRKGSYYIIHIDGSYCSHNYKKMLRIERN